MVEDPLIGRQILFRQRRGPFFVLCFALATILLSIGAATRQVHVALAAVWPLVYVLMTLVRHRAPTVVDVEADRLVFPDTGFDLPYAEIQGLRLNESIPLLSQAKAAAGELEILAADDVQFTGYSRQAGELYRFLLTQVPVSGSRQISSRLTKHLDEVLATFDDDLVYSFGTRSVLSAKRSQALWSGLSAVFAAIILVALSAVTEAALGWSVGLAAFGGFLCLLGAAENSNRRRPPGMKDWKQSSLVLSPAGVAVHQQDLVGKMSWEEVRNLRCGNSVRGIAISHALNCAVTVTIDGATFQLPDMYDRPMAIIFRQMMAFWKPEESPASRSAQGDD